MFESLAKALAAGLSLWESKEKRKYIDRLMELKRDWYAEFNKDPAVRSDAILDHLRRELCILSDAFSSHIGAAGTSPKS